MNLKEFVDYHNEVICLVHKFNKVFSSLIFCDYVLDSILICVTVFQVVTNTDAFRIVTAFSHGMAVVIDILLCCYGGQQIIDNSESVCDDFYQFNKDYILVLLRVQKGSRIKSYVYQTSLPLFSLLMSRTVSLITLLQSLE